MRDSDSIVARVLLESTKQTELVHQKKEIFLAVDKMHNAAKVVMAKGSLSFYFASRFLPRKARRDIYLLYQWCRYCDDAIDKLPQEASFEEKQARLAFLRDQTSRAYRGDKSSEETFVGMGYVLRANKIPLKYALDLLEGMADDVEHSPSKEFGDLLNYCYKVAGTVGLMFSHIVGLRDEKALLHACQLGIAMQITNICRDLVEDAQMGRCYVPHALLQQHDVSIDQWWAGVSEEKLALIAGALLEVSDGFYRESQAGIKSLPPQVALAVLIAKEVYAEIGEEIKRVGLRAWRKRIWVSLPKKMLIAARCLFKFISLYPLATAFKRVPIKFEWRFLCQK